ncbi:hypothetical protein JH26_11990 [Microvirga sp. BSC39]|nr:hypothetical protein JH26_11990 [Microvirga sp. BSC39]
MKILAREVADRKLGLSDLHGYDSASWPGSSRPPRLEKRNALQIEITGTRPAMTREANFQPVSQER